jgi:hypothetical protein
MNHTIAGLGILGMVMIQGACVPAIIGSFSGGALPPASMVIQSIIALLFLTIHSCYNKFTLYSIGNIFGLLAQLTVFYLIGTK